MCFESVSVLHTLCVATQVECVEADVADDKLFRGCDEVSGLEDIQIFPEVYAY